MYFLFTQFEFTHALGPPAARYVVEDDESTLRAPRVPDPEAGRRRTLTGEVRGPAAADVLVVTVVGAPAGRPRLLRRARGATAPAASPVPLCLVTFVKATEPMSDRDAASRGLAAVRASADEQARLVDEGLAVVNSAVRAYRAGARDPYVTEVTRRDPRAVRIGYGSTEQVGRSDWEEALEVPSPPITRTPRTARLRPAELVGAVLTGRDDVLEAEDLLVRAFVDLDHGRSRAAAHQVRSAVSLLCDELAGERLSPELAREVSALAAALPQADALVASASAGTLDDDSRATLDTLITAAERILDRWHWAPEVPSGSPEAPSAP